MMHPLSRFRFRSARPALLAAFTLAFTPLASAAADDLPRVEITRPDVTIRAMRHSANDQWILTRAEPGSIYDVLAVEGDQVRFAESNWYLVVLPRDAWGTRWVGWVSGRNVTILPPVERTATAPATPVAAPSAASRATAPPVARMAAAVPDTAAPAPPVAPAPLTPVRDVVLRFAFDRSDLSEAARHALDTALNAPSAALSFSLGGHADATGSDAYNQKLGLARAEAVRKYIVDHLQVPADRISISSFGETQPVASNGTRAGRAENRRVVVVVSAPAASAATTDTRTTAAAR